MATVADFFISPSTSYGGIAPADTTEEQNAYERKH